MVFFTIPKLTIFSFFVKFVFSIFFDLYEIWQPILVSVATITILFASLATLYQKKIKRFLAYSSINHVGYMLMGLSTGTLTGIHSFFIYLSIYIITMLTLFGVLLSLKTKTNKNIIYITDLLFLENVHPINKVILTLLFFSIAGIPPLIGFFAKFYVFLAAIEVKYYILLTVSLLCSTLSAFYYIRIIKIMNFEKKFNLNFIEFNSNSTAYIITIFGLLFTIFFIAFPNFLITYTYQLSLFL